MKFVVYLWRWARWQGFHCNLETFAVLFGFVVGASAVLALILVLDSFFGG